MKSVKAPQHLKERPFTVTGCMNYIELRVTITLNVSANILICSKPTYPFAHPEKLPLLLLRTPNQPTSILLDHLNIGTLIPVTVVVSKSKTPERDQATYHAFFAGQLTHTTKQNGMAISRCLKSSQLFRLAKTVSTIGLLMVSIQAFRLQVKMVRTANPPKWSLLSVLKMCEVGLPNSQMVMSTGHQSPVPRLSAPYLNRVCHQEFAWASNRPSKIDSMLIVPPHWTQV